MNLKHAVRSSFLQATKTTILCNLQIRKGEENERISGGSSEGRLKCKRTADGPGRQRVVASPPPTTRLFRNFENPAMSEWSDRKCCNSKQIQNADDHLSKFVRNDKEVKLLTNRRTLAIQANLVCYQRSFRTTAATCQRINTCNNFEQNILQNRKRWYNSKTSAHCRRACALTPARHQQDVFRETS